MQQRRIWMIQSCRWNKYFDFTSTAVTNYLVDYCCLVCYICSAEEGGEKKEGRTPGGREHRRSFIHLMRRIIRYIVVIFTFTERLWFQRG